MAEIISFLERQNKKRETANWVATNDCCIANIDYIHIGAISVFEKENYHSIGRYIDWLVSLNYDNRSYVVEDFRAIDTYTGGCFAVSSCPPDTKLNSGDIKNLNKYSCLMMISGKDATGKSIYAYTSILGSNIPRLKDRLKFHNSMNIKNFGILHLSSPSLIKEMRSYFIKQYNFAESYTNVSLYS